MLILYKSYLWISERSDNSYYLRSFSFYLIELFRDPCLAGPSYEVAPLSLLISEVKPLDPGEGPDDITLSMAANLFEEIVPGIEL